jgi:hypothetical protein
MKTGEELFEELDGSPCSHGRGNGWHCFACAIVFMDRIVADARAAGYAEAIEKAVRAVEDVDVDDFYTDRVVEAIRSIAPASTTEGR